MGAKAFESVQINNPQANKNKFDLTHDVKMSGRMGNLMPCCVMETVPGDKIKLSADAFVRFAPLLAPVMHRVDVYVHYWYVPNRILWDNWGKFISGEPTGGVPTLTMDVSWTPDQLRLADYLGVPPFVPGGAPAVISALPFSAYQAIYNENYRDQKLISPVIYKLADGNNMGALADLATLRKRALEHDYFTSCLSSTQQGNVVDFASDITLNPDWQADSEIPRFVNPAMATPVAGPIQQVVGPTQIENLGAPGTPVAYDPRGSLKNNPITINALRLAESLQKWLEKRFRIGNRYQEVLKGEGVWSSDKSLQIPQYITGTKGPVVISEVLNTSGSFDPSNPSDPSSPVQGNMSGHGVSVAEGYVNEFYCEEWGWVIGVMSILPKTAYQQGIPKGFLKQDISDYYWKDFAHIGEQPVLNNEIYAYTPAGNDPFGYLPVYSDHRYLPSRVAGDFRTNLDYWHLGRIFGSQPTLSQQFVECDPDDFDRIFAVQDGTDTMWIHVLNKILATRPIPVYGTPYL